jgi:HEXXH motif-containing protein
MWMTWFDWREVALLDVDAEVCFAIYDDFRVSVGESFAHLAEVLAPVDGLNVSARMHTVAQLAPHVVSGGAGYLWLNSMFAALSGDDVPRVLQLQADFVRFEVAAAISSGTDMDCEIAPDVWYAVPAAGLAFRSHDRHLRVKSGELQAKVQRTARVGAVTIDEFEALYRSPRSASQFGLANPGAVPRAETELRSALDASLQVFPGIFDRYLVSLVPLIARPGMSDAGTDDAAPFVVYSSFDREPIDLLAALAHEESHQLLQTLEKLQPGMLPSSQTDMLVPWKPGQQRKLPNVIHGLVAFGRAATVRARADRAGLGSAQNSEALQREREWVDQVSRELKAGAVGEITDELVEWLDLNLAQIDGPTPGRVGESRVAGVGVPAASFPWAVVTGEPGRAAARSLYAAIVEGPWFRGTVDYPDQDNRMITGEISEHSAAFHFFEVIVPALVRQTFGPQVIFAAAKAHRLRPGDRIPLHSDQNHPTFRFRAVLGLSPTNLGSGELGIFDRDRTLLLRLQPDFGSSLIFEMVEGSHHDVSVNLSPRSRLTVIASYVIKP